MDITVAAAIAVGLTLWNYVQDWQEVALFTVLATGTWAAWFWQRNR